MEIFLLSLLLMGVAVLAMGIGRLMGREGIRGGCGAQSGVDGGSQCSLCTRPCRRRKAEQA